MEWTESKAEPPVRPVVNATLDDRRFAERPSNKWIFGVGEHYLPDNQLQAIRCIADIAETEFSGTDADYAPNELRTLSDA